MEKYLTFTIILLTVWLFSACSPKPVLNQGMGMMPTIKDGDRLLMDENPGDVKRGDVIAFLYPKDNSKRYIKRIIGLPGEKIEIRGGKVYINEQVFDEQYVDEKYNKTKSSFPPQIIPENNYFVMGDNRDNSSDSRYWGTVQKDLIKGKYYITYLKAEGN